jgi:hypothetical protein
MPCRTEPRLTACMPMNTLMRWRRRLESQFLYDAQENDLDRAGDCKRSCGYRGSGGDAAAHFARGPGEPRQRFEQGIRIAGKPRPGSVAAPRHSPEFTPRRPPTSGSRSSDFVRSCGNFRSTHHGCNATTIRHAELKCNWPARSTHQHHQHTVPPKRWGNGNQNPRAIWSCP